LTLIEVLIATTILTLISLVIFSILTHMQRARIEEELRLLKRERLDLLARRLEIMIRGRSWEFHSDTLRFIAPASTLCFTFNDSLLFLGMETLGSFDYLALDTSQDLLRLVMKSAGHYRIISSRR